MKIVQIKKRNPVRKHRQRLIADGAVHMEYQFMLSKNEASLYLHAFFFNKFIVQCFIMCGFKCSAATDDNGKKVEKQIVCQSGFKESIMG